ncbi:hypothetical protein EJ04DRAFT_216428 [Polyplosphaeria fusca]|uniref:Uncharacterized protein n=1 Tax=Polyplosphaeria fusca TaxID=682080 RepID=A0A9P4R2H6_9PLEO|nr:hypothetical protein EJ04DRAFT_216428 [Polyplosphaeria fusca]
MHRFSSPNHELPANNSLQSLASQRSQLTNPPSPHPSPSTQPRKISSSIQSIPHPYPVAPLTFQPPLIPINSSSGTSPPPLIPPLSPPHNDDLPSYI